MRKTPLHRPSSISLLLFLALFFFSSLSSLQAKLPRVTPGAPLPSNIFIELNKVVNPAVVNISTEIKPRHSQGMQDPMEELFKHFFGFGGRGLPFSSPRPSYSLGTGFIIKKNGLILTNSHVVDKADLIKVRLSSNKETSYTAKVIGQDPKTDIALIQIKAPKSLPTVRLGESKQLQVGQWVAAFGNPFGHENSLSKGIVSAMGRDLEDINLLPFIQTDASINPGNSGGPLVNLKGEVIGVNTAIDARAQGIGFAIPIDAVKPLIKELEKNGVVTRGFLGVHMESMNPQLAQIMKFSKDSGGAVVIRVVPYSAAARAGLQTYDVITKFNLSPIKKAEDLSKAVNRAPLNVPLSIEIWREEKRGWKTKTLKATLKPHQKNGGKKHKPYRDRARPTYPDKVQSKELLESYGFDLSELNSELKKEFELKDTGKHRVVITRVLGYSKASRSGLRAGDVVYDINMKPIYRLREAKRMLQSRTSTQGHLIRVRRGTSFILAQLN